VDDGSPVSAQSEIAGLIFLAPFTLTVITQKHKGVAAARNVGLRHIDDTTTYIAFLDSEDIWLDGHLNLLACPHSWYHPL
jgi:glycosyltransferase involved in cell wall biosynthesis